MACVPTIDVMTAAPGTQLQILLAELTGGIIRQRLRDSPFSARVPGVGAPLTFPDDWPGDLLPVFPLYAQSLGPDEPMPGHRIVVDLPAGVAVGAIGAVGELTGGRVEIGYGINTSACGRGLATAAVAAFVDGLFAGSICPAPVAADGPVVRQVTARTAVDNPASARVLVKNGFEQIGADHSEQDGDLVVWSRRAD